MPCRALPDRTSAVAYVIQAHDAFKQPILVARACGVAGGHLFFTPAGDAYPCRFRVFRTTPNSRKIIANAGKRDLLRSKRDLHNPSSSSVFFLFWGMAGDSPGDSPAEKFASTPPSPVSYGVASSPPAKRHSFPGERILSLRYMPPSSPVGSPCKIVRAACSAERR